MHPGAITGVFQKENIPFFGTPKDSQGSAFEVTNTSS
jgi:hypothetical protein